MFGISITARQAGTQPGLRRNDTLAQSPNMLYNATEEESYSAKLIPRSCAVRFRIRIGE